MNDLKCAFRQLTRSPGFVLLAVVILSLGIAGNTLVFSIVNGVYLRPLPFAQPTRLVDLDETAPRWQLRYTGIAYPDFCAWRSDNRTFEGMAAYAQRDFNLSGAGLAERVATLRASYNLTDVLGLVPVLGRSFTAEEDQPGGAPVALLGHAAWQRLFGGQPDVLGQTVQLDGQPFTIVGVLPPQAAFPRRDDLWIPLAMSPTDGNGWFLSGMGRLKPGVSVAQAQADLLRIHKQLVETRPVNDITSPVVAPLLERHLGDSKPAAAVLLGTMALVLVIACANVAALMLARGLTRRRETGVRLALGARRLHLVRQTLVESLLLSALSGILGVLLGEWLLGIALAWLPERLPVWVTLDLDLRFALFAVALTLLTAMLFGLLPALQASSETHLQAAFSAAGSRTGGSVAQRRSLRLLVIGEVAMAMVLLMTAALLARAFVRLQSTDPGFRPDHLLTYRVSLPETAYPDAARRDGFLRTHLEQVRALPGVTAASAASAPPLGGHWGMFCEAENAPPRPPGAVNPVILRRIIFPGYFETMGITRLAGRTFAESDDRRDGPPVVIVNEILAQLFWPDQDAVGKRIRAGDQAPWWEVVGVVKDVKHYGVSEPMRPGLYLPFSQNDVASMAVVVRTAGEPASLLPALRGLVQAADAGLALHEVATMTERLQDSLWLRRFVFWTTAVVAAVALVLAVGGIYGVISYTATQRTSEIGLRIALGAQRTDILRMVLRHGLRLAVVGVAVGLVLGLLLAPALSSLLAGVSPFDPLPLLGVPLLLASVALLACWFPARRAASVDPMVALRSE